MTNILRSISFAITQTVYPLISYLYRVFQLLSSNQYFSSESIRKISGNIYIVLGVCMLFTLGLKLLTSIVNPDVLGGSDTGGNNGSKRTAKQVFFSILISVFLIILIPIGFDKMYEVQNDIVGNGKDQQGNQLIEKIVLGVDSEADHKPGQILASYAFASFCHPNDTVSVKSISNNGGNLYNLAITEDIDKIKEMDGVINSKTDGVYDMEYNILLSPAVGIFLVYEMIIICIDIALRSIKLGLLQLITSIVLCGYVVAGTDILKRWAKETFKTYLIVFLKVAAMTFLVYGLSLLEPFLDNFEDESFWTRGLLRVFMIIGLLQLVRQLPDIINAIFGTNIKSRGGIRGRLGEMAAVGDIAQRAWDQLRTHPLQTAGRFASMPVSAIGSALSHRNAVHEKADAVRDKLKAEGKSDAEANRARNAIIARGTFGAFGAAFRGGRQGFQQGNLRGIGEQGRRRYEETHPTDLLAYNANRGIREQLDPRNNDNLMASMGLRTRLERQQELDQKLDVSERTRDWATGTDTSKTKNMTVDEAKRNQARYNEASELINKLTTSAENVITKGDSTIEFEIDGFKGKANYAQLSQELQAMAASGSYSEDYIGQLSNDLNLALKSASHEVVANAINGTQAVAGTLDDGSGGTLKGVAGSDIKISGKINTGTFDGMQNDKLILESVMDSFSDGKIDGISFADMKTGGWDAIDHANISSMHHSQDIGRALSTHERDIENRVTGIGGRAMQQSHDLAQSHQNNNGGNNNGNNH